jgi:peroxiredoxin
MPEILARKQWEVTTMALLKSERKPEKENRAPDFSLKGIDGKVYTLESFKDARFLLVVFMCNHCPYVKQKIRAIIRLRAEYGDRGLAVAGINSNDATAYPDDNFENMQRYAEQEGFNFPYLFDETQETAKAYGAVCTPDPFLYDQDRNLVYQGRIDDALQLGDTPKTNDIADVLDALIAGREPAERFRYSMGCSIKWKAG